MPSGKLSIAPQRGWMHLLVCFLTMIVVVSVLAFGLSAIAGRPIRESFSIAFALVWSIIFVVFVSTYLMGRRNRGAILLDCGRHPARALCLFNAAVFLFLALTGGLVTNITDARGVAGVMFGITFAAYWLMMSLGRLQFTENGIWQYWHLWRWQGLEGYEWHNEASSTLMLQSKSRYLMLSSAALAVPAEQKEAVAKILNKYLADIKTR